MTHQCSVVFFRDDETNTCAQEIKGFFMDYLKNDNLGMIAIAHLVWADLSEDGARCEQCLELASLHSKAVDFPKSGVPAEFPTVSKRPAHGNISEHQTLCRGLRSS